MSEGNAARDSALEVLKGWSIRGGRAESLFQTAAARYGLDERDRSLAMELVYGVIRYRLNLDYVLSRFIKKPEKGISPVVMEILRIAAYQSIYLDRVPNHALVYSAVEQAKKEHGRGAGSFVNGVLRSLLRGVDSVEYPDSVTDPVGYLGLKYSFPGWMAQRWVSRFGPDEAGELMAASNRVPPLTVRVNTLKVSRAGLAGMMEDSGVVCEPTRYSPDGLVLRKYPAVHELPGYDEGCFAVQDEAAQLVSMFLKPEPGQLILDACAAPGGKSCHLSALSGDEARVVASDISLDKLLLLKENVKRLGHGRVHPVAADACAAPFKGRFDGVLVDAPCSSIGVIRRRPEIKYNRSEDDIRRLSRLQSRVLLELSRLVRPGGTLVYSTCSTEPEEGEAVVGGFLLSNCDFVAGDPMELLPEHARSLVTQEGFVRTFPHRHGTDGFFIARLIRKE